MVHRLMFAAANCKEGLARKSVQGPSRKGLFVLQLALLSLISIAGEPAYGQGYLSKIGRPDFTPIEPVEMGFINLANGNLHIEIPLASVPQRGSQSFHAKLVYDSRIWNGSWPVWYPSNDGGWRFIVTGVYFGVGSELDIAYCLGGGVQQEYQIYGPFYVGEPDGTVRYFPILTTWNRCGLDMTSGDAYASDGSGYRMFVTNSNSPTVYKRDGTQVSTPVNISMVDTNGNYPSLNLVGDAVDTLGRVPVTDLPPEN